MTEPKDKREVEVSETLIDNWDDDDDAFVKWNPDGSRVSRDTAIRPSKDESDRTR